MAKEKDLCYSAFGAKTRVSEAETPRLPYVLGVIGKQANDGQSEFVFKTIKATDQDANKLTNILTARGFKTRFNTKDQLWVGWL